MKTKQTNVSYVNTHEKNVLFFLGCSLTLPTHHFESYWNIINSEWVLLLLWRLCVYVHRCVCGSRSECLCVCVCVCMHAVSTWKIIIHTNNLWVYERLVLINVSQFNFVFRNSISSTVSSFRCLVHEIKESPWIYNCVHMWWYLLSLQ